MTATPPPRGCGPRLASAPLAFLLPEIVTGRLAGVASLSPEARWLRVLAQGSMGSGVPSPLAPRDRPLERPGGQLQMSAGVNCASGPGRAGVSVDVSSTTDLL